MILITIGSAARKLGMDVASLRRRIRTDVLGQDWAILPDGMRLRVYREHPTGHRYFDATEIAYKQLRSRRAR